MDNEISKRVLDILSDETCVAVTSDTTFESLGLDSLDYLAAMVRIESAFNLEIPGAVVAEFNTAGDVIAFIEGAQCA